MFCLSACLVLISVENGAAYMKNFGSVHLFHGYWNETSKLLYKDPSYIFYCYREAALA